MKACRHGENPMQYSTCPVGDVKEEMNITAVIEGIQKYTACRRNSFYFNTCRAIVVEVCKNA